jgi:hypothetical protein
MGAVIGRSGTLFGRGQTLRDLLGAPLRVVGPDRRVVGPESEGRDPLCHCLCGLDCDQVLVGLALLSELGVTVAELSRAIAPFRLLHRVAVRSGGSMVPRSLLIQPASCLVVRCRLPVALGSLAVHPSRLSVAPRRRVVAVPSSSHG